MPTQSPREQRLFVNSERVPCTGVTEQLCLQVRQSPEQPWQLFYDTIYGFDYQDGYLYELRVRITPVVDPPADASSTRYELIEIVSQTLVSESHGQLPLAGSRWVLERFGDQSVLASTEITLMFDDTDSRAGGRAGCNSYSAGFTTDDGLSFMNPVSTLMACAPEIMEQESRFFRALEGVTEFLLNDNTLTLIGNEDLVFRAEQTVDEEAAAFEGSWVLASLSLTDGETVTLQTEFDVTLNIDTASNSLVGHASCNRYSAPFIRDGNRLQLSGVALTRMACEDVRMQQEATFVRVLEGVTNFQFDNGGLILSGEAGGLVFVPQP